MTALNSAEDSKGWSNSVPVVFVNVMTETFWRIAEFSYAFIHICQGICMQALLTPTDSSGL